MAPVPSATLSACPTSPSRPGPTSSRSSGGPAPRSGKRSSSSSSAWIALRLAAVFVHGIVKTLMDREATEGTAQELSAVEIVKRMTTIETLAINFLRFIVVVIAGVMLLDQAGLDVGPAIAGLGVVGIAVGFGAQHLVKDYLNGALILIENQFSKGDVIRVAGVAGSVEDFSLRRTTLRDLDGVVHTVPNGEIEVASNLTRVWSRINQNVQVAYGTDIDRAIERRRRRRPGAGVRSGLEAQDPRDAAGRAGRGARRIRRDAQDPRAPSGRRSSGRRPASSESASSPPSRCTGSRSPGPSEWCWPARRQHSRRGRGPRPHGRGPRARRVRVPPRADGALRCTGRGWWGTRGRRPPAARDTWRPESFRERRTVPGRRARDREPPRRAAHVPARSGLRRAGERARHRSTTRRRRTTSRSGNGWRASGSRGRSPSRRRSNGTSRSRSGSSAGS